MNDRSPSDLRAEALAALAVADDTVHAVAIWSDVSDSVHLWPQAIADNRRSRVLARINRYGIPCDADTLIIVRR